MYPELFSFDVPEFLRNILGSRLTIHSYGFCIATGILIAWFYAKRRFMRELGLKQEDVLGLVFLIIIAAVVGGKLFFFLEKPAYYFGHPATMLKNPGSGFVFFGSLLFVIPSVLLFLKKNRIPWRPVFDILAFVACIVHAFGRMGCFLAGCCHGKLSDGPLAVVFSNPSCAADIKNHPVHPTQLYEIILLSFIFLILTWLNKRKKFDGQIFLVYLMLYAGGRILTEFFRGDPDRGFIVPDILSYGQFTAILIIAGSLVLYRIGLKSG